MSVMLIRLLMFIPLVIVTYQVIMLRRSLPSRSWTLIAAGFVVFAVMVGVAIFIRMPMTLRLGITLLGYTFVAVGFRLLRKDIRKLTRNSKGAT